jgi:hypothetical protein
MSGEVLTNEIILYGYLQKKIEVSGIIIAFFITVLVVLLLFDVILIALYVAIVSICEIINFCFNMYQKMQCKKRIKELLLKNHPDGTKITDINIEVS